MQNNATFFQKVQASGLWPAGLTMGAAVLRSLRIQCILEILEERRLPPSAENLEAIDAEIGADRMAPEAP